MSLKRRGKVIARSDMLACKGIRDEEKSFAAVPVV